MLPHTMAQAPKGNAFEVQKEKLEVPGEPKRGKGWKRYSISRESQDNAL